MTWRVSAVAAVLAVETLLMSYLIQKTPVDWVSGPARVVRDVQHWFFRFLIVYVVSLTMLAYLRNRSMTSVSALRSWTDAPWRIGPLALHVCLLLPFAVLSANLYSSALPLPFAAVAVAWHVCALAAALALIAAAAPLDLWIGAVRRTGMVPVYALLAALAAVVAIHLSQGLWKPTATFTFRLVLLILNPLLPTLQSNFSSLTLSTDRFAVAISEKCSGLEGVGLMLAFCATWLWYFRREYRFPRALVIVPVALLLAFVLNVLRIAALVAIGDAGYPSVAMVGFHSQAGWIAFNTIAFGVAVFAKRSSWMRRDPGATAPEATVHNATAAYLMPLLAILAAGMISHALSSGFELFYPLRLVAAIVALWVYRETYATFVRRISWRAPAVGVLVACVWFGFAHFLTPSSAEPQALVSLPAPLRVVWVVARTLAATLTVPIAEELAYRGYLLRRLVNADFQSVSFATIRWPALAICAVAFGIMHGAMWLPAVLAGIAYGAIAIKTGRIGEAVAAHATTNAVIAGAVLLFDQWQLW
jgi:exosortase E/protease (VPEID-CTERM system)